mgnify:CR=1 FL=1
MYFSDNINYYESCGLINLPPMLIPWAKNVIKGIYLFLIINNKIIIIFLLFILYRKRLFIMAKIF